MATERNRVDVTVIGAGPAGTMTALYLQQRGVRVRILEKSRFPRFVIGESLLPSAMHDLDAVGLIPTLTARGYLEKGGVAIHRGDQVAEFDFAEQFSDGWTYTWQVKRADFDRALADAAQLRGVDIEFDATVTGFSPMESITWLDHDGVEHCDEASFVIDASGYGRVVPRLLGLVRDSGLPPRMSIFTHVAGDRRPEGRRGSYSLAVCHEECWVWVIPFSDGTTSVGAVADPTYFARWNGDHESALHEIIEADDLLARRFAGESFAFPVRSIRAFAAASTQLYGPGYCLVGNSGEFIDPIFSSGVTIAMASARLAAAAAADQLSGRPVDWQSRFAGPLTAGLDVFRDYVNYWYDGCLERLFYSNAPERIQRQLCSVLAGYVWDDENPFVANRRRKIPQLLRILDSDKGP